MRIEVCTISLLIGYLCGMFLTAELVAKRYAGTSSSEIGSTGNPGMANIMAHLGFKPGILVLAFSCHRKTLRGIRDGSTEKNNVLGAIRKKLKRKD